MALYRYSVDVFRPPVQTPETLHLGVSPSLAENRSCGQSGDVTELDGVKTSSETLEESLEADGQHLEVFNGPPMEGDGVHNRVLPFVKQSSPSVAHSCELDGPAVQVVFGQQRSGLKAEHWEPSFDITPVNHCGITLTGSDGRHLEDKGW